MNYCTFLIAGKLRLLAELNINLSSSLLQGFGGFQFFRGILVHDVD